MPEQPDPVTQHLVGSGLFAHVSSLSFPHRGRGLLYKLKISPDAQNLHGKTAACALLTLVSGCGKSTPQTLPR